MTGPQEAVHILYILGAGHCGSTLLSLALDRHPNLVAVSEIVGLNAEAPGAAGEDWYYQHPFWARVASEYKACTGSSFWDVSFKPPRKTEEATFSDWSRANALALASISSVAGKRVVVDASKQPRRLSALLKIPGLAVKIVYLVRDARAIIHSYDRKYHDLRYGIRRLARIDRSARLIRKIVSEDRWMTIRYEDFAAEPQVTLKRLCNFVNVDFAPIMLQPDSSSFVGIGGNRLRSRPVDKIVRDDAWRKDMGSLKKFVSALIFLAYNRRFGYS